MTTSKETSAFVTGYDFYKKYLKSNCEKNFLKIFRPYEVNLGLSSIFDRFKSDIPSPIHESYVADYLNIEELEFDCDISTKTSNEVRINIDPMFTGNFKSYQAAKMLPHIFKENKIPDLLAGNASRLSIFGDSNDILPGSSTVISGGDVSSSIDTKTSVINSHLNLDMDHLYEAFVFENPKFVNFTVNELLFGPSTFYTVGDDIGFYNEFHNETVTYFKKAMATIKWVFIFDFDHYANFNFDGQGKLLPFVPEDTYWDPFVVPAGLFQEDFYGPYINFLDPIELPLNVDYFPQTGQIIIDPEEEIWPYKNTSRNRGRWDFYCYMERMAENGKIDW